MKQIQSLPVVLCLVASSPMWAASGAESHSIDTQKSTLTVRVFKSGVFSAFGHDHTISAPIASGSVDVAGRRVELKVKAGSLRVVDRDASERDRAEIQKTMLGQVLDAERYPDIVFRSTSAERAPNGAWIVHGELTQHGRTRPVAVEVTEKDGHYVGATRLRQTEYGIQPVKIAGGTVRVKDEVGIEFDIQLTP